MNRKIEKYRLYIIFGLIITLSLFISSYLSNIFYDISMTSFDPRPANISLFLSLFVFGLILGSENIFKGFLRGSKLNFDKFRFIILSALPLIGIISYWLPMLFSISIIRLLPSFFISNRVFSYLIVVLFSWSITSSFIGDKVE